MTRHLHITVPQELRAADGRSLQLAAVSIAPTQRGTQVQATWTLPARPQVALAAQEMFDPQIEDVTRNWLAERIRRWSTAA